jgi:glycerophosphoryl diester phosphodiesterase
MNSLVEKGRFNPIPSFKQTQPELMRTAMEIRLFGHRGAAGEAPENTMGGFAHALRAGMRAFELDIHLSRDNQLVVIHDATLDRTTDGSGWVSDRSAEELASLNAAHQFPDWQEGEGIPTLEQVLAEYHTGIKRWKLEIKKEAGERLQVLCQLLLDQIERFDLSSRVTVTSFDPSALEIMQRLASHLPLALINSPMHPEDLDLAKSLGCSEICMPVVSGSAALVSSAQRRACG